jgi:hypothetical protein
MRRPIMLLMALCLAIVLPASTFGAKPTATIKLTDATAFFKATDAAGDCWLLTASLLSGPYRAVAGDPGPPSEGAQLWTYLDQVDCADPNNVIPDTHQEWVLDLNGGDEQYVLNPLAAAYLDTTSGGQDRTFTFWLAWAAYGTPTTRAYPQDSSPTFGRETDARLAGTVVDEPDGLDWQFERATMSELTIIQRLEPEPAG